MNESKNLRVVQTIASTRLDHGGTSRSVPAICDAFSAESVDNFLLTVQPGDDRIICNYPADRKRVLLVPESRSLIAWRLGRDFEQGLSQLCSETQSRVLVHDHGVWLPTNHAAARFCRRLSIPRVVSPRGMLGAWALANGKMKKRVAWWMYQRADLASADGFHATSDQEAEEIRALGLRQPILIAPNGLEMPEVLPSRNEKAFRQALFLSRIHPKKGLLNLVRAWNNARGEGNWKLVIAGPDENGHRCQLEAEVARLGLQGSITFVGNVDGAEKWQLYADSDLFVLPSFNENFGIVIAEAMSAGLPVITTTATPWSAIRDKDLGWWIPPEEAALTIALRQAMASGERQLRSQGERAAAHVRTLYSWKQVAEQLAGFYSELTEAKLIGRIRE